MGIGPRTYFPVCCLGLWTEEIFVNLLLWGTLKISYEANYHQGTLGLCLVKYNGSVGEQLRMINKRYFWHTKKKNPEFQSLLHFFPMYKILAKLETLWILVFYVSFFFCLFFCSCLPNDCDNAFFILYLNERRR